MTTDATTTIWRQAHVKMPRHDDPMAYASAIEIHLPATYAIIDVREDIIAFRGYDSAGWTLNDDVIPRLASGLHVVEEVRLARCRPGTCPTDDPHGGICGFGCDGQFAVSSHELPFWSEHPDAPYDSFYCGCSG